jgi:hypothetical protein
MAPATAAAEQPMIGCGEVFNVTEIDRLSGKTPHGINIG